MILFYSWCWMDRKRLGEREKKNLRSKVGRPKARADKATILPYYCN